MRALSVNERTVLEALIDPSAGVRQTTLRALIDRTGLGADTIRTLRSLEMRGRPLVQEDVDERIGERFWCSTSAGLDALKD